MLDSITDRFEVLFSYVSFQTLMLVLTALCAVFFLVEVAYFLPVIDENFNEVPGVVKAQRWAQGEPLYADYRMPPYLHTPFPPLWYVCMVLAAKAGFHDVDSLTLFGRLFSFVLLLGSAVLTYLWNRTRGFSRTVSLLTPALFFSFPSLINFAVAARQDIPAIFLCFLAVFLVTRERGSFWVVLAGATAGLAFLMKHSSLAVPTAIVLWLLAGRKWRPAVAFALVWGALVGATILGFEIASDGLLRFNLRGTYYGSLGLGNTHELLIRLFVTNGQQFSLLLLAFGLLGFFNSRASKDERSRLLRYYFATSFGFALLASSFANASINHFLEPALVWALLAASGMAALQQTWPSSSTLPSLAFAVVLTLLVPALDVQRWEMLNARPSDLRELAAIARGRRVLTDIPFVGARSSEQWFLESVSLTFAEERGGWSSAPIVADLQAKRYDLVILHWLLQDSRWTTHRYPRLGVALRSAIQHNYGLCGQKGSAYVYAPLTGDTPQPAGCPSGLALSR